MTLDSISNIARIYFSEIASIGNSNNSEELARRIFLIFTAATVVIPLLFATVLCWKHCTRVSHIKKDEASSSSTQMEQTAQRVSQTVNNTLSPSSTGYPSHANGSSGSSVSPLAPPSLSDAIFVTRPPPMDGSQLQYGSSSVSSIPPPGGILINRSQRQQEEKEDSSRLVTGVATSLGRQVKVSAETVVKVGEVALNANRVVFDNETGHHIVAAGIPTFHEELRWRALRAGNYFILNLANPLRIRKGSRYPIKGNEPTSYGTLLVSRVEDRDGYAVYSINERDQAPAKIQCYHYAEWERLREGTGPSVEKIHQLVGVLVRELKKGNVWVHCDTGFERTAIIIAAYQLYNRCQLHQVQKVGDLDLQIVEIMAELKQQRSDKWMFEAMNQYDPCQSKAILKAYVEDLFNGRLKEF